MSELTPEQAAWLSHGADLSLLAQPPEKLFPHARLPAGAVAGIWLFHGRIDEAHQVAQDLNTADGAFWHGIVHRREPDPVNAAYWFRRVGSHAIFPALLEQARAIAAKYPAMGFTSGPHWDPFAWIDFWERARVQPESPSHRMALEIQQAEWSLLFHYCVESNR